MFTFVCGHVNHMDIIRQIGKCCEMEEIMLKSLEKKSYLRRCNKIW